MRSTKEFKGLRVRGGKRWLHKIGKVQRAIFYPDGKTLAGFLVKRMDFLFMFKRKDRFFAADSFQVQDGRIIVDSNRDSWDRAACKRLNLDWKTAVILEGMTVFNSAGRKLGRVEAIVYDENTKEALELLLSTGTATKTLLGLARVPFSAVCRRKEDCIFVNENFVMPETEGGLAAKAGERAAIISNSVSGTAHAVGSSAGRTVNKLAFHTGRQIGKMKQRSAQSKREVAAERAAEVARQKQAGKNGSSGGSGKSSSSKRRKGIVASSSNAMGKQIGRSRGMFKSFGDEYRKAAGPKAVAKNATSAKSTTGAKKAVVKKAGAKKAVVKKAGAKKAKSTSANTKKIVSTSTLKKKTAGPSTATKPSVSTGSSKKVATSPKKTTNSGTKKATTGGAQKVTKPSSNGKTPKAPAKPKDS